MGNTKTLGQIAAEAYCREPVPWDDDADPKWREHWDATASAVRKAVLEEAIEECFHDEQLEVWSNELLSDLGAYDYIADPASYDDVVHMHKVIQDFLKHTVASRISSVKLMCHERPAQVDQSVSAQAPFQSDNHREAEG